ncbi:adenine phosphoribosyltransferase [Ischnura elegans]|uniref:adenine phosphoribosyltransferase n=1 Tax=Ischnura elegans TaxID=197161 RepID=UPI001ED8A194|nr:adenine phosphoribosyltransferase [Ischnura elegans]
MDFSEEILKKIEVVKTRIGAYPDFPKPGICFRDIFSVYHDKDATIMLDEVMKYCAEQAVKRGVQVIAALECRGFLFGPQMALHMGVPFVPLRKKGKLPGKILSLEYDLEYGKDTLEVQEDSIPAGKKVLIVDDLLATGGSLQAACELVKKVGAEVSECLVVMEIVDLKGRTRVPAPVFSLIQF